MYDCQFDHYTGFDLNNATPCGKPAPSRHLKGELTAQALDSAARGTLDALQIFCCERGYQPQREDNTLTLDDISFEDTLTINARFGDTLVISAHLRREKPVSISS